MNKGIWAGLVAIAFVAGSITTGTIAYAAAGGQGNDGIIEALGNIVTAIQGINPNVDVDVQAPAGQSCWDTNGNGEPDLLVEDVNGDGVVDVQDCQGLSGELDVSMFSSSLPPAVGRITLTQPDFDVASFNQVIGEVELGSVSGPGANTFEPFVLVSTRPSSPPTGVVYNGDISHKVITRYTSVGAVTEITYLLQFFLETQPQPPGTPGIDPAPAGSRVVVNYRVVFANWITP